VRATGDSALDAELPGGGWPVGALTEILQPPGVHSEWRLLLPALAQGGIGAVVLVAPPQSPFAPALAALGLLPQRLLWVKAQDAGARLWSCEQALRCADVAAVLAWLPLARSEQLRRLQMAAASYSKLLFVMRPEAAQGEASPAALRLHVHPSPVRLSDHLQVNLLKRRGPPLAQPLQLPARSSRLTLLLASAQAHALDCTPSRT
jgi:protein ImuA